MSLDYKSLIKKVSEFGDLVILGIKGSCKTTLLMQLARELRANPENHVCIFETFPKWINEFDQIGYLVVRDEDVKTKEDTAFLDNGTAYIQWSKDYHILNSAQIIQALKENTSLIFLIECEDMEKISAVMTFIIYTIYRKQYLRAKANCLESTKERFWFLTEESHNLLDSTVIAKKTFNKLRKIQNEFRNLKMHMICVALRLQDLSPKIRTKMSIVLAKVSLDDYQLKVRNLLRNSKFRDSITTLEKGKFVFPETDLVLEVQPFQQIGKPYELKFEKPQLTEQTFDTSAYPKPRKENVLSLFVRTFIFDFKKLKRKSHREQPSEEQQRTEDENLEHASLVASDEDEESEALFW